MPCPIPPRMLAGKWRLRCLWLFTSPGRRAAPFHRNSSLLLGPGKQTLSFLRSRNSRCRSSMPSLRCDFLLRSAPGRPGIPATNRARKPSPGYKALCPLAIRPRRRALHRSNRRRYRPYLVSHSQAGGRRFAFALPGSLQDWHRHRTWPNCHPRAGGDVI